VEEIREVGKADQESYLRVLGRVKEIKGSILRIRDGEFCSFS